MFQYRQYLRCAYKTRNPPRVGCVAVVSPDHQLGQGRADQGRPAQPSPVWASAPVFRSVSFCRASPAQPGPAQPSPAQPRVPCSAAPAAAARAGGEMLAGDVDAGHLTVTFITLCSALASRSRHSYRQPQHALPIYLYNLFYYLSMLYLFYINSFNSVLKCFFNGQTRTSKRKSSKLFPLSCSCVT